MVETCLRQQILDQAEAVVVHRGSRRGCYCFGPAVGAEEEGMTFLPQYCASGKISENCSGVSMGYERVNITVRSSAAI